MGVLGVPLNIPSSERSSLIALVTRGVTLNSLHNDFPFGDMPGGLLSRDSIGTYWRTLSR